MQVILLERVEKLGTIGDEVNVKNGFGRNFLIPQGKALLANAKNRARFEHEREAIEARNADARVTAEDGGKSLDGVQFLLIRSAGDTGHLYGSVAARDIVDAAAEEGHKIGRSQVRLDQPIKTVGIHEVRVRLHAEVAVTISLNVARSPDEAERQAAGENIIEALSAEQKEQANEQSSELAQANAEMADQRGPDDRE
ncbi:MAG: 50S ribosomal protein L9 [Hyphomonadaceae bacterium]